MQRIMRMLVTYRQKVSRGARTRDARDRANYRCEEYGGYFYARVDLPVVSECFGWVIDCYRGVYSNSGGIGTLVVW